MHLVLSDPSGKYWDGALVTDEMASQLGVRGACTIPVDPSLFARHALGGFFERRWGAGIAVGAVPSRLCGLALFISPGFRTINWRARIQPTGEPIDASGVIRVVQDSSQIGVGSASSFSAVDTESAIRLADLGEPDALGGWHVGAAAKLNHTVDGLMGLMLYGAGRGVRIAWAAVSQTQ